MRNIKLLLLLVLMLSAFVTEAQHKPFQFGFRGALNLGWFTTDQANFSNQGADIGGSYGFVADIYLMENYSFTTGINLLYLNGTTSQTDKAGNLGKTVSQQVPAITHTVYHENKSDQRQDQNLRTDRLRDFIFTAIQISK